jgi:hypothetical protein
LFYDIALIVFEDIHNLKQRNTNRGIFQYVTTAFIRYILKEISRWILVPVHGNSKKIFTRRSVLIND